MAQIEKRDSGYKITVYLGKDEKGVRKYKRTTYHPKSATPAEIKKEVEAYARDYELMVKGGKVYDEKLAFSQFVELWKRNYAETNLEKTSIELHEKNLRLVWLPAFAFIPMANISSLLIQETLNGMNNLSRNTIENRYSTLRGIMSKAYTWGVIAENPCDRVEIPRAQKQKAEKLHYFTASQARAFLDYIDGDIFWSTYFTLAIYGGFRRGELCALTWKSVDFKRKTITIKQALARVGSDQIIKQPKTASSRRTVPLHDLCFMKLKKLKASQKVISPDGWVFAKHGKLICIDSPLMSFRRFVKQYNAEHEDKLPVIRLHDLRHTTATLLIGAGVDVPTVSYLLGHSRVSTTMNIYTHPIQEHARESAELMAEILKG